MAITLRWRRRTEIRTLGKIHVVEDHWGHSERARWDMGYPWTGTATSGQTWIKHVSGKIMSIMIKGIKVMPKLMIKRVTRAITIWMWLL